MSDFFSAIMAPLKLFVAWIMVAFHQFLTFLGMRPDSGWTWALSIVGLVVVIRILLIPLFVKQIKASRGLQLLQPEMKKIQEKYKGKSDQASRQAMAQEQMELYRKNGTNPLSSCMPLLLQSPVFFALFTVLNGLGKGQAVGPLTPDLVKEASRAELLGAPLTDTFMSADGTATQVVTIVLIILMSVSTFTSQHQLMRKNMPAAALDNPFAQQQKMLLYAMPLIFAVSGVNFPIGVLIYWLTTNIWSMCQQFYVIRRMPTPGSLAEKAYLERKARHNKPSPAGAAGIVDGVQPDAGSDGKVGQQGQRQQPKRQARSKRKGPQRSQATATGSGEVRTPEDAGEGQAALS
jgi:YidC/Oxa1 family membrane protein insertase